MADEKWQQIYGQPVRDSRSSVAPLVVPRVNRPTCPEHCSGRHETDGIMQCPHCKVPAYRIISHEYFHADGMWWFSLEGMNGFPPGDGKKPVCNCGREMVRA